MPEFLGEYSHPLCLGLEAIRVSEVPTPLVSIKVAWNPQADSWGFWGLLPCSSLQRQGSIISGTRAPLSQTSPHRGGGPETDKLEVASLAGNKKGDGIGFQRAWENWCLEMHPPPCAGLKRVCFLLETTVIEI